MEQAASHYGPEGKEVLKLVRSTPAERQSHAHYFSTDSEGAFRWFRGGLNYTWLDK